MLGVLGCYWWTFRTGFECDWLMYLVRLTVTGGSTGYELSVTGRFPQFLQWYWLLSSEWTWMLLSDILAVLERYWLIHLEFVNVTGCYMCDT